MAKSPGFNPGSNGITLDPGAPLNQIDVNGNPSNLANYRNTADGPAIDLGMWAFPAVDAAGSFQSDGAGNVTFGPLSGGGTVTSVAAGTGLTATPSPITTTGTIALANTAVAAGSYTYASITVDAQGRLTAASSGAAPTGTVTHTAGALSSGQLIIGNGGADIKVGDLSGDVSTSGSTVTTLANTAVTAGSYTYASITVDAKGRLTAASSGSAPGTGTVTHTGSLTAHAIILGNGTADITALGSLGTTTTVLHGNAAGDPSFGQIVNADITNSTIDLTAKVTGVLPVANGGTGASTLTIHGVVLGNTTSAVNVTAAGSAHTVLHGNGAADPTFSAVDLASADVTGTLALANGGLGSTTGLGTICAGANVNTSQSTNSTSYTDLSTSGPSVTLTTGTSVIVSMSAFAFKTTTSNSAFLSVAVSGATTLAAADTNGGQYTSAFANGAGNCGRTLIITGLTAGSNTFKLQYRVDGGTFSYFNRSIVVYAL